MAAGSATDARCGEGGGWREERRGDMGQITTHSNPYSSFSLSFFPLCVQRGFDEKIPHASVQNSQFTMFFLYHQWQRSRDFQSILNSILKFCGKTKHNVMCLELNRSGSACPVCQSQTRSSKMMRIRPHPIYKSVYQCPMRKGSDVLCAPEYVLYLLENGL